MWWSWWIFWLFVAACARRKKNTTTTTTDEEEDFFEDAVWDPILEDPPAENNNLKYGVFGWASYAPRILNKSSAPLVRGVPIIAHWRQVEPNENQFAFEKVMGRKLVNASVDGFSVFLSVWLAPDAPDWLYEHVDAVFTDRSTDPSTSQTDSNRFPNYGSPRFRFYVFRLIDAFSDFVRSLPGSLRSRVMFVQSAEGSTGDGYGYKGDPTKQNATALLSRHDFSVDYRTRVWTKLRAAMPPELPVLYNLNLERFKVAGCFEVDFLLFNSSERIIGLKLGMFSHGYHVSRERRRRRDWLRLLGRFERAGKHVFSRGEFDREIDDSGWASKNTPQALYWSALYALHNYLDHWNVPQRLASRPEFEPALRVFDRYAGYRDARTSDRAFVAFRQGLDASDLFSFPESKFGVASKRNDRRYLAIAAKFASRGALEEDVHAARAAAMMNRRSSGYNDVGWGTTRGNFRRHLYQLRADETSTGLWHYPNATDVIGRFARGLAFEPNKTRIDLAFHPAFRARKAARVSVVYFDEGRGTFELKVRRRRPCDRWWSTLRRVLTVTCSDSRTWRQARLESVDLPPSTDGDAVLPDIRIEHVAGDRVAFHFVETQGSFYD